MSGVHRIPDLPAQDDPALFTGTVKPGRTGEDLLFEVLINCGLNLSARIVVDMVDAREVFVVDDGTLIACLAKDVSPTVVRAIARRSPSRAVFLDSGFATGADRISAEQIFADVSPATEVQVI